MVNIPFKLQYVGTGSKGNSALVTVGDTRVLIDAGINPAQFPGNISISDIDALLISHDHGDHAKYAKKISEKYQVPMIANKDFYEAISLQRHLRYACGECEATRIGDLTVMPFPVMHDKAGSRAFLLSNNNTKRTLLFIPECGTLETLKIQETDFIAIEANYDDETIDLNHENDLIEHSLYNRITGKFGHFCIDDALMFLKTRTYHYAILHNMSNNNLNREKYENILPGNTVFAETGREYIL